MAKSPLPSYGWIATHLVAAGLGLAVWGAVKPDDGKKESASGKPDRERFRSERRGDRSGHGMNGDDLLTSITGRGKVERVKKEKHGVLYSEVVMKVVDDLLAKADEVPPAEDVAAAGRAVLDKLSSGERPKPEEIEDMKIRLLHWLREDPKAALATNFKRLDKMDLMVGVMSAAVKEKGVIASTEWLGINPMADTDLRTSISFLAGAEGNLQTMAALKEKFPPARWGEMRTLMAQSWKLENGDQLLELAEQESAPAFLLQFVKTQRDGGFGWLRQQMASETMDPELQASVMKRPEYRDLYVRASDVPLDERLAVMRTFSPNRTDDELKLSIGVGDVQGALDDGRDWRYAFRFGAATLDEVSAAITADLPELAKSAPEALHNHLLKELAEDNGAAVIASLSGLPEDKKWEAAIKPARSMFYGVNPQELFDYLQHIPTNTSESVMNQRLDAWTNQTGTNHWRLEGEYVDWVRNLPDGLDRQMASFALMRNAKERDPQLAESLRAEITDPMLVKKMEEMK